MYYTRYIQWHIIEMSGGLPKDAETMLMKGERVCHQDGIWNSVFSDQFGEQMYIRYGKAKGGLIGLTLSADQVVGWLLSYHMCHMVSLSMDNMFENSEERDEEKVIQKSQHKKEGKHCRKLDEEVKKHTHTLKVPTSELINVENGRIASEKVNVHMAVEIGDRTADHFHGNLPDGLYELIVPFFKGTKVGNQRVYEMKNLYASMLVLSQKMELDLKDVFSFELALVPFALFDEYGDMRKGQKSTLATKLAISCGPLTNTDVELDENEMLYRIMWPKRGMVKDLANNFVKSVTKPYSINTMKDQSNPMKGFES